MNTVVSEPAEHAGHPRAISKLPDVRGGRHPHVNIWTRNPAAVAVAAVWNGVAEALHTDPQDH